MAGVPFCALLPLLIGVCGAVTGSRVYPANEGEALRPGSAFPRRDTAGGGDAKVRRPAGRTAGDGPLSPPLPSPPGPAVRRPLTRQSSAPRGRPWRRRRCRGAERPPPSLRTAAGPLGRSVPSRPTGVQRSRQRRWGGPQSGERLTKPVLPRAPGGAAARPRDSSVAVPRGKPAAGPVGEPPPCLSVRGPAPGRDWATPAVSLSNDVARIGNSQAAEKAV